MIDEDRTLSLFGYTSDELKHKSGKPIAAVCEECGKYRVLPKAAYHDICRECSARKTGRGSKGKKHTVEARRNMSVAQTGRSHSKETLMKMSRAQSGENHPNWQGGVSSFRSTLHHSPSYKNWRAAVFKRDDYTCQMCNERGGKLEAHHIRPVKDHKNDLLVFDVGNGATLCKDCHRSIRQKEDDFIGYFTTIIGCGCIG